jgi:GxxExxY protein
MAEILFKELSFAVIGVAMEVHSILGPGFLEAVYQTALEREMTIRNISFISQKRLLVVYKDMLVGDYIEDLVVDSKIIVEIKSVSRLNPSHQAQALHYLAATGYRLAILINFGCGSLEYRRIIK